MMKPISIVIITYNRPDDLMVLLRNLVSQMQASQLLEQILIINNASTISYESVMGFMQQHPEMPFEYVDSKENLGVARGRNAAISKARAPIIVTCLTIHCESI
jgi:glycosyltransferase involved in cell wall biosynthesis